MHMKNEIITPDREYEQKLRPSRFEDFTGQDKIRERLELFVQAARERNDVLDHVLLSGPPGLGKTTLSYILADAMGVNIKCTSGPVIDKPAVTAAAECSPSGSMNMSGRPEILTCPAAAASAQYSPICVDGVIG